jgi:hypothetical protein
LEADYPSCWSRKTCKPHALAQWRGRSAVVVGGGPSKGRRGSAALPIPDSRSAAKRLRGRDASYLAPPAQIRTCGFPAHGSYLGCVTANACRIRSSVHPLGAMQVTGGCRMIAIKRGPHKRREDHAGANCAHEIKYDGFQLPPRTATAVYNQFNQLRGGRHGY